LTLVSLRKLTSAAPLVVDVGGPPDPRSYQGEQRRDHHGAHVEQVAQANDDAGLRRTISRSTHGYRQQVHIRQTTGEDAGARAKRFRLELGPRFAAKALYRNCA